MKLKLSILLVLICSAFNMGCAFNTNNQPKYVEGVVQRSTGEKLINYEVRLTSDPNNLWNQFQGGRMWTKIGTVNTDTKGNFNIPLKDGRIPPKLLLAVISKKYKTYIINDRADKFYYHFCPKRVKINSPDIIIVPDNF